MIPSRTSPMFSPLLAQSITFSGKNADVVCVGSMMRDIFIQLPPAGSDDKELLLPGAKLDSFKPLEEKIGGGAANVTMNFKKLGLNPLPLSRIADDNAGRLIRKGLQASGIDLRMLQVQPVYNTSNSRAYRLMLRLEKLLSRFESLIERATGQKIPGFMLVNNDEITDGSGVKAETGQSVILNREDGDRTVVTSRGVSNQLRLEEVNWQAIQDSAGLYISNFGSKEPAFLTALVAKAKAINPTLRIAFNPGGQQLEKGLQALSPVLSSLDILNLNLEEARKLLGDAVPPDAPVELLLKRLKLAGPVVVVITNGMEGASVYDGQTIYSLPAFKVEFKSTLGAGDAFGSTFMAYYLEEPSNLAKALYHATSQAASVVTQLGAQTGLKNRPELEKWAGELIREQEVKQVQQKSF